MFRSVSSELYNMGNVNVDMESDHFTAAGHPEAVREIRMMAHHVSKVNGSFKREMLISFLKDHSLKVAWLTDNDLLVQMITSGALEMYHTERLFESRRGNKVFLADLEGYIATELANCPSDASHGNVLSVLSSAALLPGARYYACQPMWLSREGRVALCVQSASGIL